MKLNDLEDIVIGGIDMEDYPELSDAYLESATLNGEEITEEEREEINEHHGGWVYEIGMRDDWEDYLNAADFARKREREQP